MLPVSSKNDGAAPCGDARLTAVWATADNIKVNSTGDTRLAGALGLGLRSLFWGKQTSDVKSSSLMARKGLSLATVGTGKVLDLGGASLQSANEDLSLTSAGSIALGTANVNATRGSISAVSAGSISGVGSAPLRAGQNLSIDAGQGNLVIAPWQASYLSAGQDLSLAARTGLLKLDGSGGYSAAGASRVSLAARDLKLKGAWVDIQGASLTASRDLLITATDGSVNIAALENTVYEGGYPNR